MYTQTQTWIVSISADCDRRQFCLAPQVYTSAEYFGDPEEEIAAAGTAGNPDGASRIPAVEPGEFESVYGWFLS
jgi:hypothetical protein